jgi:quercetin dioxygenase-like cupin family protein
MVLGKEYFRKDSVSSSGDLAMHKIEALSKEKLPTGLSSPGIARHVAFKGEDFQVIRSRIDPGTVSGWHHHNDYEVYGYVVSGAIRLEAGPDGRDVTSLGPGDFFHVPARTVHREANPSAEKGQEVILFLRGTGAMVVNVEGPDRA